MDINKHGVVYYSPIYNWGHEDVMAYIEHFNIKLPLYINGLMVLKWEPAPGLPENIPVLYKKAGKRFTILTPQ